jgi:hypothetical protein
MVIRDVHIFDQIRKSRRRNSLSLLKEYFLFAFFKFSFGLNVSPYCFFVCFDQTGLLFTTFYLLSNIRQLLIISASVDEEDCCPTI